MASSLNGTGVAFSDSTSQASAWIGGRGQVFTSGTTSWTVPAGVTAVKVTLIGGGGAGGGATSNYVVGAGGGGAGAALAFVTGLTPGASISVTVGAGGTGGTGTGGSGGTSSFGAYVSATGGGGGVPNGAAGTAGTASGTYQIGFTGTVGGVYSVGYGCSTYYPAVGGCAGPAWPNDSNWANWTILQGVALPPSSSVFGLPSVGGIGAAGTTVTSYSPAGNGQAGKGYGAGGAGARRYNAGSYSGGSGTAGIVIVEW